MDDVITKNFTKIRPLIITHKRISGSGIGSVRRANKCFEEYTYRFGRAFEQGYGLELAERCIKDREPAVRCTGAYYLLPYQPLRAKMILRSAVLKGWFRHSYESFSAEMTLREWKKKRLKFPRLINGEITYINIDRIKGESL